MAGSESLILLQIFAIFVAAKVVGGIAGWLRIPSVVGEISAGVILGNTFLKDALKFSSETEILAVLAELGVIFLIFTVGLETPLQEMRRVGGTSLVVAILGVIVPFVAGYGIMAYLGAPTLEGLFLGAALVATSVGITARVLADLGVIGSTEARIILGAAVIDDILGLTILTIVQALAAGGDVSALRIGIVVVEALAFVAIFMFLGERVVTSVLRPKKSPRWGWVNSKSTVFTIAIIFLFGLSALAGTIGLAAIIGAFLAGMAFASTPDRAHLIHEFETLVKFLVPFFFVYIGLNVDLAVLAPVAPFALAVTAVAIFTKVAGCGLGAIGRGLPSATAIGIGMVPRGEVGIIVALVGLSLASIPTSLYAVVVAMSILTTLVAPPALVWSFRRLPEHADNKPAA
ncbi:MAG TPA: cation:proton antiporter [Candidatus Thermoplasmatota archaeon]|nr:cation:proton antiporter [Candidatus Thermoplasmatota archaeon]